MVPSAKAGKGPRVRSSFPPSCLWGNGEEAWFTRGLGDSVNKGLRELGVLGCQGGRQLLTPASCVHLPNPDLVQALR